MALGNRGEAMNVAEKLQIWWKSAAGNPKRFTGLLAALGVAGMLLIAASEWLPEKSAEQDAARTQTTQSAVGQDYAALLEQRLCALLACQNGVGRVKVMVTLVSEEQTVYAKDKAYEDGTLREESHVLASGGPALVETVEAPQILGVAVVCDGGDDAAVAGNVTQILSALTGVGASHISVTKMVPTG